MVTEPPATGESAVASVSSPPRYVAWATGLARFAGLAMVLLGVLQIIAGTGALLQGELAGVRHVLPVDAATWGWIHLVLGALVGLAGTAVITGRLWGRMIGIALAVLSIGAFFLTVSHHPGLSIVAIALGGAAIWALCVFDEEASAAAPTMLD
jgi:hypothetical protein